MLKMNSHCLLYILIASFVSIAGCGGEKITDYINKDTLENKGLLNLALASNGTTVRVSEDNPEHPASTLINGVTSSENWDGGEGWEFRCDNIPVTDYSQEMQNLMDSNRALGIDNPQSYGIRVQTSNGMSEPLGWVVMEFPEKKIVNRMVVHTIDSEKYPAEKFGVSYLILQYWTEATLESEVTGWKVADLVGGIKSQSGNVIRNNKNGVIPIRFEPVKTQRMRLAVWWTNDSKIRSHQFLNGSIRLVEVEVYGYEGEKSSDEQISIADYDDIAQIKVILDTYAYGYSKRDIDMLMSSISPEYSKNGEAYAGLQKRMVSIFAEYKQIGLKLQNIKVMLTDTGMTANATASYELNIDSPSNTNTSGIVTFNLSKTAGLWKIIRIDK